jgi:hypothetical protein
MPETFQDYLASRRITGTPAGGFTREIGDDPALAAFETWPQLRALIYRRASGPRVPALIKAAQPVWKGTVPTC